MKALKELGPVLLELMSTLTHAERVEVFEYVKARYCHHCGIEQDGGRRCQCWNDE